MTESAAAPVPQSMMTGVARIEGHHVSTYRMQPNGSREASPGAQTTLTFPQNGWCDTPSTRLWFRIKTIGGNGDSSGAATEYVRLPNNAASIVSNVFTYIGGRLADGGETSQLGFEHNIVKTLYMHEDDRYERNVTQRELFDDEFFLYTSNGNKTGNEQAWVCIDFLPTFLWTVMPRLIDMTTMGETSIDITWANARNVLQFLDANGNGLNSIPTDASYKIDQIYATTDIHSFSDPFFQNMARRILSEGGTLTLPFNSYPSQEFSSHSGLTLFPIYSQSIDELFCTFRPKPATKERYRVVDLTVNEFGTGSRNQQTFRKQIAGTNRMTAAPQDASNDVESKKLPQIENNEIIRNYQFQLNQMHLPNVPVQPMEAYEYIKNGTNYKLPVASRKDFYLNAYLAFYKFTLPHKDARTIGGIDSRGLNVQVGFETNGGYVGNYNLFMMAKTTRTLEIGPNQQVKVNP